MIIEPLIFVIICYWLTGLRSTFYAFGVTAMCVVLVMNVATACGCFFSTAFNLGAAGNGLLGALGLYIHDHLGNLYTSEVGD